MRGFDETVLREARSRKRRGTLESWLAGFYYNGHELRRCSVAVVAAVFSMADRDKLLAACDRLPKGDTFTAFRGVSGRRRSRGFWWCRSLGEACWYAVRDGLPKPVVYEATISRTDVLLYYDRIGDGEFVVMSPPRFVTRLALADGAIRGHAAADALEQDMLHELCQ